MQAATQGYVDTRVLRSGDTMTGMLELPATLPTLATSATNKAYVDQAIGGGGNFLPFGGGNMTGTITWGQPASSVYPATAITVQTGAGAVHRTTYAGGFVRNFEFGSFSSVQWGVRDTSGQTYLTLGVSSLTGASPTVNANVPLYLSGDPTDLTQAATKRYVDQQLGGGAPGPFVPVSGGNMTGQLYMSNTSLAMGIIGTGAFFWQLDNNANYSLFIDHRPDHAGANRRSPRDDIRRTCTADRPGASDKQSLCRCRNRWRRAVPRVERRRDDWRDRASCRTAA